MSASKRGRYDINFLLSLSMLIFAPSLVPIVTGCSSSRPAGESDNNNPAF